MATTKKSGSSSNDPSLQPWDAARFSSEIEQKLKEQVKEQAETLKEELREHQNRVIEVVGIFAALLAFVAFEAQIFKGPLSTQSLVGVTLVIFGALSFFVLLLDLAFDAFQKQRLLRYALTVISFACLAGGFFIAKEGYFNSDHKEYYTKEQVDEKIENASKDINQEIIQKNTSDSKYSELLEFKNCILKQGLNKCL